MDQLSEKQIWYYHIIPKYQTEKSFYACVRKSGMMKFDTFYFPHMISARETQRSIKFGDGVSGRGVCTILTFTPTVRFRFRGLVAFCFLERRRSVDVFVSA